MTKKRLDFKQLADYLDQKEAESDTTEHDDNPLVQVAYRLQQDRMPQLSEATRQRIDARVSEAIKAQKTIRPRSYRLPMLASAAVLIIVLIFVPVMSASAVPGDLLYGTKRLIERAERAAAPILNTEAGMYLRLAQRRADEALILLERGTFTEELINESLDNLNQVTSTERVEIGRAIQVFTTLEYVVETAIVLNLNDDADTMREVLSDAPVNTLIPTTPPTMLPTLTATMAPTTSATPTSTPEPSITASTTVTLPSTVPVSPSSDTVLQPTERGFIDATARVNVRIEPRGAVVTVVNPLTTIEILGQNEDGSWIQIELPDGSRGWIVERFVTIGEAPQPTPMRTPSVGDEHTGNSDECQRPGANCNVTGEPSELPDNIPDTHSEEQPPVQPPANPPDAPPANPPTNPSDNRPGG